MNTWFIAICPPSPKIDVQFRSLCPPPPRIDVQFRSTEEILYQEPTDPRCQDGAHRPHVQILLTLRSKVPNGGRCESSCVIFFKTSNLYCYHFFERGRSAAAFCRREYLPDIDIYRAKTYHVQKATWYPPQSSDALKSTRTGHDPFLFEKQRLYIVTQKLENLAHL